MNKQKTTEWKMKAQDCYTLLETQRHRCALSGLILTPNTTEIMHREPLEAGGKHTFSNIMLVDSTVYKLAKGLTPHQLALICAQILENLCLREKTKSSKPVKHIDSKRWRILLYSQTSNFNKLVKKFRQNLPKSRKKYFHTWGEVLSQKINYFERNKAG